MQSGASKKRLGIKFISRQRPAITATQMPMKSHMARNLPRIDPSRKVVRLKSDLSSGHPLRGGCVNLKLVQSALWSGRYFDPSSSELESAAQPGSAAKAVCSMERLFVPDSKHGSGIGDCIDGGGVVLKRTRTDPAGEIESFRRPGRAALNSTGKELAHEKPATAKQQERQPSTYQPETLERDEP